MSSAHDDHDHDHGHDEDHAPREIDLARYAGISGHEVRTVSGSKRELLAVIPRDRFEGLVDAEAGALARKVTLRGFRPGKAPVARVRSMYAREVHQRAVERLVNDVWEEVRSDVRLRPVGSPVLEELSAREGEPVRFAATFEVLPEVTLAGLDDLRVESKQVKVTDRDVEEEMEALRSMRGQLVPSAKQEASPGDLAVVDLSRYGPLADPASAEPEETREGMVIEVGVAGNLPELDRALLGMAVGEARGFDARVPADHPDARLAGSTLPYRVRLTGIRERRLPELTDELAREMGLETVGELQLAVRERIRAARVERARREQDAQVLEQLLARNPCEIPKSLIERTAEERLRAGLLVLARRGVDVEKSNVDWKAEFGHAREAAERDLRADYLLELVAKERGVEVSDDEVWQEIERLAARRQVAPKALRSELVKASRMNDLKASLRRRRTLDLLESGASITVD